MESSLRSDLSSKRLACCRIFQSPNHNLIKEIVEKKTKWLRRAAAEKATIQLREAKELSWQGLSFKNGIQRWDYVASQEVNELLGLVCIGLCSVSTTRKQSFCTDTLGAVILVTSQTTTL